VNLLEAVLQRAVADVERAGHTPALVGGLAVSARSEPRFTRDADLVVGVASDDEAEALIGVLGRVGYRPLTVIEQRAVGRLATVRLAPPGLADEAIVLDLLFASSGAEPEIVEGSEPLEVFPEVVIRVASVGDLIALKVLARDDRRRPQDAADLRALFGVVDANEMARARRTLTLIEGRGYARGRDLSGLFEHALTEFAPSLAGA
jgi:hypothetical protein